MTQTMLTGAHKSKAVIRMPVENIKTINYGDKAVFIRNHGSFNHAFVSTSFAIIGQFTIFEGGPLDPLNAECFVGKPRISVLNSSKWFL